MFSRWLKPIFTIGLKRPIESDDIYDVVDSMRSEQNTEAFAKQWESELRRKNPSIFRIILKLHGFKILSIGFLFSFVETMAKLIQPICLGGFISYFSQIDGFEVTLTEAYWYASGIVFSTAFMLATLHPFNMYVVKMSSKIRVGCSGLIYQKTLRLTKSQADEGENGRIINLLTNDIDKFDTALVELHDVLKGPLEVLAFSVVIYMEIGVAALVGIVFLAGFVPLQGKNSIFSFQMLLNRVIPIKQHGLVRER